MAPLIMDLQHYAQT